MTNNEPSREVAEANAKANELFARLAEVVEGRSDQNVIDVLEIVREVDLDLDEAAFADLRIDRFIYPIRWLPWYHWFPWRPLYCWWWHRYYPHYRCCPWWWHRCHWYPYPI